MNIFSTFGSVTVIFRNYLHYLRLCAYVRFVLVDFLCFRRVEQEHKLKENLGAIGQMIGEGTIIEISTRERFITPFDIMLLSTMNILREEKPPINMCNVAMIENLWWGHFT
jgi:hypothetical protein